MNATTPAAAPVGANGADVVPSRPPLVLHARVVTGAGGGPDKTILNSPRFLKSRGYDCACLFLRPPGDELFEALRQRGRAAQAPLVELDDDGPWRRSLVADVTRICADRGVTIWHAHDYKTNLLGLLAARRVPLRLVTTCHGWVERTWRTLLYHQVDRLTLRRYERVIAVSADIEAQCLRFGVPRERLIHVPNAIDAAQFARRRTIAEAKQGLGWPAGRLLIGAVGRLSPEKGFDVLIDAVAQLVRQGRDVGAAIAGGGAEEPALRQLIAERNLADRVRLLGFQSDLIPFYEAMDVFALSSRREGLPNVLLEAMAVGAPVVATRVAGVPTLIDDGGSGLLVSPESADELAAALARLSDDAPLRERLAAAGRATIESRFSFDARMDRVAAVYDELLRTPAPRSPRR